MPSPTHYSRLQITLHWVIMALILFNIVAKDGMKAMYSAAMRGTELAANDALLGQLHIYAGIGVLVLAALRIGLRLRLGAPAAPPGPHIQKMAGYIVHWAIYVLLFTMPISGMVAWFGGIETAASAHEIMKIALLILVGLHTVAALYHQFWLKDNNLARMWRSR